MRTKSLLLILGLMCAMSCTLFAQTAGGNNGPRTPKYTCVDIHKYEHTMWMTCALFVGDEQVEDFEVAVFDKNGECRADAISGVDEKNPAIAYVTIYGVSNEDKGMTIRVVYGDEQDRQKYDKVIEGKTLDMVSNRGHGSTDAPFRLEVAGEPSFSWTVGEGALQNGNLSALTPALLQGATSLSLRGTWSAADIQKLQEAMPKTTLQEVSFSAAWENSNLSGFLSGTTALTAVRFQKVPQGDVTDFLTGANPNCLIYLPAQTLDVPVAWSSYNVVSLTETGYTALTDINLLGSTPEHQCPFALDKDLQLNGHSAVYTPASMKYADGKGGWNTIVLPFDADVYADGIKLDGETDVELFFGNYWLMKYKGYNPRSNSISFIYEDAGLLAHVPYLLAVPGDKFGPECSLQSKAVTFRSKSDVIKAVSAKIVDASLDAKFTEIEYIGTYSTLLSSPMYLLANMESGLNAFVYNEKGNLLPFHAYMLQREGVAATVKMLMISGEYLPTGIGEVEIDEFESQTVFDLSGRKVDHFEKSTPGIYVVNGKKQLKK